MSLNPDEIVVAGTGHVYRAPVGTAFPRVSVAPAAPWVDLGYCSEAGAAFSFARTTVQIKGWQSFDPLRVVVSEIPKSVKVELLQWNEHTQLTAMGGGTWTEPHPGEFTFTPPDPSFVDTFAYIITGTDGSFEYRFHFKNVMVDQPATFSFTRAAAVVMPVGVLVLAAPDGSNAYEVRTTDDALGDASVASS